MLETGRFRSAWRCSARRGTSRARGGRRRANCPASSAGICGFSSTWRNAGSLTLPEKRDFRGEVGATGRSSACGPSDPAAGDAPAVSRPWSPCRWRRRRLRRTWRCGRRSSPLPLSRMPEGPSGTSVPTGSSATACGRHLAVLLFEACNRGRCRARDEWIGSGARPTATAGLHLAKCTNKPLAWSPCHGSVRRQPCVEGAGDGRRCANCPAVWEERHACRTGPVRDLRRCRPGFDGACYREPPAWQRIGMTAGKRSGRGAKHRPRRSWSGRWTRRSARS